MASSSGHERPTRPSPQALGPPRPGSRPPLMPRIRTIKPEAPQHPKIGRLSDAAFRLWVVMLTQADDDGRLPCDAGQLKLLTWGYYDDVTVAMTEGRIQEIARAGCVLLYEVAGVRYAWFPSWRDHQVINKKKDSKLPAPPRQSRSSTGAVPDLSGTSTVGS